MNRSLYVLKCLYFISVKYLLANLSTEFKYVVIQEVKEHFIKIKTKLYMSFFD